VGNPCCGRAFGDQPIPTERAIYHTMRSRCPRLRGSIRGVDGELAAQLAAQHPELGQVPASSGDSGSTAKEPRHASEAHDTSVKGFAFSAVSFRRLRFGLLAILLCPDFYARMNLSQQDNLLELLGVVGDVRREIEHQAKPTKSKKSVRI
jgi:hypothetical protein